MTSAPKWAQDITINALIFLGDDMIPNLVWRRCDRSGSSGLCKSQEIVINAGWNRVDAKMVLLHELAHWALPVCDDDLNQVPVIHRHEGHTPRFWDMAWRLYRKFKLPMRYCKEREGNYMKGALAAYRRLR